MRVLISLSLLAACAAPASEPGADTQCTTPLDGELAKLGVPGLSVGIVAHGQLHCTQTAGMADLEKARPVTPDTAFAWASVSKTVTAAATMILVDEGKLDLDADIDGYLPFAVRNPSCATTPITTRQLLTHTSSIIDDDDAYNASYNTGGDSPIALGAFVQDYLAPAKDNFDDLCPGQVNEYSNVAIGLLGYIVERVANQPFDRFVADRVFAPLGMTASFRLADLDVDNVAMPYDGTTGAFHAHGHNGFPTYPDGLVRAAVPELAKFLANFIALGAMTGGAHLVTEASSREMRRLQVPALDDTQGLIWFYDYNDTLLGHDGDDPGTSSFMYFDPTDGSGALIVANGFWYDADEDAPAADALLVKLMAEAKTY